MIGIPAIRVPLQPVPVRDRRQDLRSPAPVRQQDPQPVPHSRGHARQQDLRSTAPVRYRLVHVLQSVLHSPAPVRQQDLRSLAQDRLPVLHSRAPVRRARPALPRQSAALRKRRVETLH